MPCRAVVHADSLDKTVLRCACLLLTAIVHAGEMQAWARGQPDLLPPAPGRATSSASVPPAAPLATSSSNGDGSAVNGSRTESGSGGGTNGSSSSTGNSNGSGRGGTAGVDVARTLPAVHVVQGHVSPAEYAAMLRGADAFVLPSRGEVRGLRDVN